jgi:putative nucleotidyltransferase with HDIG domain
MVTGRHKYNPLAGLFFSLAWGGVWALLSSTAMTVDVPSREPLGYTVRLPTIKKGDKGEGANLSLKRKIYARGQTLAPAQLDEVHSHGVFRTPWTPASLIAPGLLYTLLVFLFSSFLRSLGGVAAFLRTHLVVLCSVTVLLVLAKLLLMLTGWSSMAVPVVAVPLLLSLRIGRAAACGGAALVAVAVSTMVPFDLPLLLVALAQGLTAGAVVRPGRPAADLIIGTIAAAVAGTGVSLGVGLLLFGQDIAPATLGLSSVTLGGLMATDFTGAAAGAVAGGLLAALAAPAFRLALGQVSRGRLTTLADFKNPLLKQLASEAPGSWAHSTNLANMAEMASNQIGADGLLLRVGAYYHDIGKSQRPNCFVENQRGENPHDELEPERSAAIIRAHVTDGVKLARRHNVPEAVVEFIYTHHGAERLEYFWHKARSLDHSHRFDERDFRYDGVRPLTREHAILSICDSLEAASRTLKHLDQIEQLVRQIVLTKLQSGALDESGLSVRDLRLLTNSAVEFLRGSLHSRVEYPWQRKENNVGEHDDTEPEATPPTPVSAPRLPGGPEPAVPLTKRRRSS